MTDTAPPRLDARVALWNNPAARSIGIQVIAILLTATFCIVFYNNTVSNLTRMNQVFGFGFLGKTAGFDISQTLASYTSASSYGRALFIGLLNTALIAVLCIVASTLLGFLIGVMRLSKNRLAASVATIYIETFRNIPLLLQIFVWYSLVVLQVLPVPREAFNPLGVFFLSNRGLAMPRPIFGDGAWLGLAGLGLALVIVVILWVWARRRQERTGQPFPVWRTTLALVAILPLLGLALARIPVSFEIPLKTAFGFRGGLVITPELIALFLALSIYHATYIAEAVRAGIQSVSHGQTEAAAALGISSGQTLGWVVVPQAMRVIIPPLATIYMGVIKNSSLAVAIGYPDLVAVGGTVLNQTGRAIEVVLIWMSVYLSLSLITSLLMNWFNNRMKLVER